MKTDTHPKYTMQNFTCSCGNVIELPSTSAGQGIEICSNCHPYYTGKQKMIDSGGRIEKFTSRYTTVVGAARKTRKEAPVVAAPVAESKTKAKAKAKAEKPAKAAEAPAAVEAPAAE
ncbi:MAG TPA: 50S ribosomal protein L31 [Fibrobacteria bacterium]|jgi:large subunit ribosomal protein L31|nr:50S ribosomal protein L31 [Fibrobacteria bacterium]